MFVGSGAASTMTAYGAGDIKKYDPNSRASLMTLGTSNSSWNPTTGTEGTPAGGTSVIAHFVPPTSGIYIQYPLGREPEMPVSTFLRLRNTLGASVNVLCGIAWEE
jgi:PAB1-binding protein PBP1